MDLDGDAKAQEALNRIQTAEAKRAAIAEQLEDCVSQINQYDARKEQLDAILRDNQTTTTLQKKKEDASKAFLLSFKQSLLFNPPYKSINLFNIRFIHSP